MLCMMVDAGSVNMQEEKQTNQMREYIVQLATAKIAEGIVKTIVREPDIYYIGLYKEMRKQGIYLHHR